MTNKRVQAQKAIAYSGIKALTYERWIKAFATKSLGVVCAWAYAALDGQG